MLQSRIIKLTENFGKTFFLLLLLSSFIIAQETKNIVLSLNEEAIGNLKNAIQSDNNGLRKSGIYFAGKYAVEEVSETLLKQLKKEEDPNLRVLIVRVFYILENYNYMDEIYELALNDENVSVRKMASAVYDVMKTSKTLHIADLNN